MRARETREKSDNENLLLPKDEWGTFSLRVGGVDDESVTNELPASKKLMESLEPHLATEGAFFYSIVNAGAHIPRHADATNIQVTLHMGIEIPSDWWISVDDINKTWQEGKCFCFDPTFAHEVWNHSMSERICLMFDIWNPESSQLERKFFNRVLEVGYSSKV